VLANANIFHCSLYSWHKMSVYAVWPLKSNHLLVATSVAVPESYLFLGSHPVHLCLSIVSAGHRDNQYRYLNFAKSHTAVIYLCLKSGPGIF
jgi:hypothetical protein